MKKQAIAVIGIIMVLSVCAGSAFAGKSAFSLNGGAEFFGVALNEETSAGEAILEHYLADAKETKQSEKPVVFTNVLSVKDVKELNKLVNNDKDGFIEVWQLLMEVKAFTVPYTSWNSPKIGMRGQILEKSYAKKHSAEVSPMVDNLRFIYTEALRIGGADFAAKAADFAITYGDQNFVNKANGSAQRALFNTAEGKALFNTIVSFRKGLPKYARFLFNVEPKSAAEQINAAQSTVQTKSLAQSAQPQKQAAQEGQPIVNKDAQWNKETPLANPAAVYAEISNPAFIDFQAKIRQTAFIGDYANEVALEKHNYVSQRPEVLGMLRDLRFLYTESAKIDETFARQVAALCVATDGDFASKINQAGISGLFNTNERNDILNRMVGFRNTRLSQYGWYLLNL